MREMVTLINKFRITGEVTGVNVIHEGHIHDSYRITTTQGPEYFLQRINTFVFKDVDALMSNISKVLNYQQERKKKSPGHFPATLSLVNTWNGKTYLSTQEGNFWRMYHYIPDSQVHSKVTEPLLAYEGGKAFGAFMMELAGLDPKQLKVILPQFHDFKFRYDAFLKSLEADTAGRKKDVAAEIEMVEKNKAALLDFNHMIADLKVPLRVTHNDTKFNNVLFDAKNQPLCVIDLDTVMPGSMLHDYGDAIRTAANAAAEDESSLLKVKFDFAVFRSFTKGYLKSAATVLTKKETDSMAFSAIFMTFIIGLRFLTDHLNGDVYYQIQRPGQNLDRARVQFELANQMTKDLELMKQTIRELNP